MALTKVGAGVLNIDDLYGFRNRIINGDMRIDQRNAGASVTPINGQYTLDRWRSTLSQASKYTVQQNAGAVTPPSGFSNYLGVTSTSAYSVVTDDIFSVSQFVEGFNAADLGFGTANAKPVTLSFWVRSSLTGTFGGALHNGVSVTRSYPFTYTVSAANTWEQKTVSIPGDTSGTWLTNNSLGLAVQFGLGGGATFSGTAGAWASSDFRTATGATSVVGTNGATFFITGVQLEAGSVATPFERRPFGTELALCCRYFWRTPSSSTYAYPSNNATVTNGFFFGQSFPLPVQMRAAPTGTKFGTFGVLNSAQPAVVETDVNSVYFAAVASGTGAGHFNSNASGGFTVSAEL
jgi:hypothetical protein